MRCFAVLLLCSLSLITTPLWGKEEGSSPPNTRGFVKPPGVSDEWWERITPHLISKNHPLKKKLDKLFAKKRIIKNQKSLLRSGFDIMPPQQHTHVIIASHPQIPGYLLKLYTDNQKYHMRLPEYYLWVFRAEGARLVREIIAKRHWEGIFKAPQKWIYPIPLSSKAPKSKGKKIYYPKQFILVVEDMNIHSEKRCAKLWKSGLINSELLSCLQELLQEAGLWDGAKPANIPFSRDGRIAFVDTQSYYRYPVVYHKLDPMLNPELLPFWQQITAPYR